MMRGSTQRSGVLFLDVLIGLSVFAIIVSCVVYAMLFSQQGMLRSGDRIRGVYRNQQAVAAVRAVRNDEFSALTEGTYGVQVGEGDLWELTETITETADGYSTTVTLESLSDTMVRVHAQTTWSRGVSGSGSATLTTDLTDWRRSQDIGNWASASLAGAYIDEGTPLFNDAAVSDTHAFVTSETSDGGNGLYVFDISGGGAPVRVASAFHLGVPGYQLLLVGDILFVATGDAGQEIRAYDVADPEGLSAAKLLASIDVPGSAKVRALQYFTDTLYVASQEEIGVGEFFTYDVSDIEDIALLDTLNDDGSSFSDIHLANGYAYLASSLDTMELRVVDVFDPSDISFASGEGYNLTDTTDGTSVVAAGGYLLLGRNEGTISEEVHLFDISESPVPSSPPYNAETGEGVRALDIDPTATYAFAATAHDSQELVVLSLPVFAGGGDPLLETYNTATGEGRGVRYSVLHDRVFLLTNTAVLVLRPS